MADQPVLRPKRQGNYYIPPKLLKLGPEIAARYAAGESAASLARLYGCSKAGVHGCARRQGIALRDKFSAGHLCRTADPTLTQAQTADRRPIAQQVADNLGYASHKGLSYNREFQSAVAKERRRRFEEKYREIDRRRQEALNRIPAWQSRKQLVEFYEMAHDLGLEIDHINPLPRR